MFGKKINYMTYIVVRVNFVADFLWQLFRYAGIIKQR